MRLNRWCAIVEQEQRRRIEEERRKRQRLSERKGVTNRIHSSLHQGFPPLSRTSEPFRRGRPTSTEANDTSAIGSSAETYDKSDAMSDEEDLVILGAETDIGLKSQEMKRQQRELNNWKKVLYAGKHAVASEGSAGALSAPPADVVAKVFGTVQSKEEKEKLLCHVQLVKQGLAFGQTCGPGS